MNLCPITFAEASAFVAEHHRHHRPPVSWLFGTAAQVREEIVGVAMVGRPVSRVLQDDYTAEVIRLCTKPGAEIGCASMLLRACWRAAKALGYRRLITYTLATESGASLRGAGFTIVGSVHGRSWHCPSRPRVDKHPTQDKLRWQIEEGTAQAKEPQ